MKDAGGWGTGLRWPAMACDGLGMQMADDAGHDDAGRVAELAVGRRWYIDLARGPPQLDLWIPVGTHPPERSIFSVTYVYTLDTNWLLNNNIPPGYHRFFSFRHQLPRRGLARQLRPRLGLAQLLWA
eukprot:SAG25_NODE_511_length_7294_cov_181.757192_6_plen_127_part_00